MLRSRNPRTLPEIVAQVGEPLIGVGQGGSDPAPVIVKPEGAVRFTEPKGVVPTGDSLVSVIVNESELEVSTEPGLRTAA
jgi:hypothetical protein